MEYIETTVATSRLTSQIMINVTLDIIKTSSVKFDEPPVIRQICHKVFLNQIFALHTYSISSANV